ncbi:MAG TPA: hypothetical protein VHZ95_18370 [Polyangiales bacterium]|nr:hypothetical protein [Polyangiales bacterium]
MSSIVRERFARWVARDVSARPLERFRIAFGLVWFAYDACDLAFSGTAWCASWILTALDGAPLGLQLTQVALLACQLLLITGRRVPLAAFACCGLRLFEYFVFFRVNDFLYYAVVAVWLGFAQPFGEASRRRVPAWVLHGLLIQTGWIYLASAFLKLNPAFLSGEHFFVRYGYMTTALHWPYPAFVEPWLLSLPFDRALALLTVSSEALLGTLLIMRRGRLLACVLAICIHTFAAVGMNVFFFGASLIAQVCLLFPARRSEPD